MAAVENYVGLTITYTYDARSNRSTMYEPSSSGPFSYSYDPAGRIASLINPQNQTTTFLYDRTRRSAMVHGNGVTVSYTYDLASRLLGVANLSPTGPTLRASIMPSIRGQSPGASSKRPATR